MENEHPPNPPQQTTSQNHNLSSRFKPHIPTVYPVQQPTVTPEILHEPFLLRVTHCLMYFIRFVEYKLSPSGRLRQWFKLNLLLMLWIAIPVVMILPFLPTGLFAFSRMMVEMQTISFNLFSASVPVLVIAGICVFLYRLVCK